MKNLIERVLERADQAYLETQMTKLSNIFLDKKDLDDAIDQMKEQVSFWIRVNPFSHKEEKYQLQDLKRERDFYEKEYKTVSNEVKDYLLICLKDDAALSMKALAGQMQVTLDKLYTKIRRHGLNKNRFGGAPQVVQLEGQITYFNELLNSEYNFPLTSIVADDIVQSAFKFLLDTQLTKPNK